MPKPEVTLKDKIGFTLFAGLPLGSGVATTMGAWPVVGVFALVLGVIALSAVGWVCGNWDDESYLGDD